MVRINEIKSEEVPAFGVASPPPLTDTPDTTANAEGDLPATMGGPLPPHLALKAENNSEVGASGYGVPGPTWDRGANLKDYYSRKEEQEVQATLESEEVDLNAGLHGNWTLENAKARLNQYFQKEKIQGEYKYTQVGPDHNRSFIAEMTIYIKQLGRRILHENMDQIRNWQHNPVPCHLSDNSTILEWLKLTPDLQRRRKERQWSLTK